MAAHGQGPGPGLVLPAGNYELDSTKAYLSGPGVAFQGRVAPGMAIMAANLINIQAGATIVIRGSTPVSFEGNDVTIEGKIVSDGNGFPGAAPPYPGRGPGNGAGPGGGNWGQNGGGGGAGYGGKGGAGGSIGGSAGGAGGKDYHDFQKHLQNGSGGAAFGTSPGAGAGGGNGGGAVQVVASGVLLMMAGSISVAGTGGGQSACGGGGASGGSIVLQGQAVKGRPVLNVSGGPGGPGAVGGGGGAGGVIMVITAHQGFRIDGFNVSGGAGGSSAPGGQGQPGEKGVMFFQPRSH